MALSGQQCVLLCIVATLAVYFYMTNIKNSGESYRRRRRKRTRGRRRRRGGKRRRYFNESYQRRMGDISSAKYLHNKFGFA